MALQSTPLSFRSENASKRAFENDDAHHDSRETHAPRQSPDDYQHAPTPKTARNDFLTSSTRNTLFSNTGLLFQPPVFNGGKWEALTHREFSPSVIAAKPRDPTTSTQVDATNKVANENTKKPQGTREPNVRTIALLVTLNELSLRERETGKTAWYGYELLLAVSKKLQSTGDLPPDTNLIPSVFYKVLQRGVRDDLLTTQEGQHHNKTTSYYSLSPKGQFLVDSYFSKSPNPLRPNPPPQNNSSKEAIQAGSRKKSGLNPAGIELNEIAIITILNEARTIGKNSWYGYELLLAVSRRLQETGHLPPHENLKNGVFYKALKRCVADNQLTEAVRTSLKGTPQSFYSLSDKGLVFAQTWLSQPTPNSSPKITPQPVVMPSTVSAPQKSPAQTEGTHPKELTSPILKEPRGNGLTVKNPTSAPIAPSLHQATSSPTTPVSEHGGKIRTRMEDDPSKPKESAAYGQEQREQPKTFSGRKNDKSIKTGTDMKFKVFK